MKKISMVMVVLLGLAMVVQADIVNVVPIVNGDFEDTTSMYPAAAPVGWTATVGGVGVLEIGGRNVCIFNQTANPSQVLYQHVNHQIVSGATYDYSVDINNGVEISDSSGLPSWDSISVQLWAIPASGSAQWLTGGSVLPSDFTAATQWKTFNFQYVDDGTYADHKLLVQFQVIGGIQSYIDNVQVTETIPEPATMALLGIGGVLGLCRRRS